MAGGGGGGQAEACLQGGVEGFLKGSERPEAGCLGEFAEAILCCLPSAKRKVLFSRDT